MNVGTRRSREARALALEGETWMPRYYFDITDAGCPFPDLIGVDLANGEEAREDALALLPTLFRDMYPAIDAHEVVVAIRNETGAIVYEASLSLSGRWWPGQR